MTSRELYGTGTTGWHNYLAATRDVLVLVVDPIGEAGQGRAGQGRAGQGRAGQGESEGYTSKTLVQKFLS